jgi:hypothetical protein
MSIPVNRTFAFVVLIVTSIISSITGHHTDGAVLFAAALIIGTRN